jgi:hypothetical protein
VKRDCVIEARKQILGIQVGGRCDHPPPPYISPHIPAFKLAPERVLSGHSLGVQDSFIARLPFDIELLPVVDQVRE